MATKRKRKSQTRRPLLWGLGAALLAVTVLAVVMQRAEPSTAAGPVKVVAVGDIACDPADPNFAGTHHVCQMRETAKLALGLNPVAVLVLGDLQYEYGARAAYAASYDQSWGRLKAITHPVPGNHEYGTPNAAGYFDYWAGAAGLPGAGYYSYDLGDWHIVALNSNCAAIGGCEVSSVQEQWLRADLAAHPKACTLAYMHHPRFSSGSEHGDDAGMQPLWQVLQDAHADVVLAGHEHIYERFAPQRADGIADPNGITEFVVGTGGKELLPLRRTPSANSLVRDNHDYGVLKLSLEPGRYGWEFVTTEGRVLDSGSANCTSQPVAGSIQPTPLPTPRPTPGR